MGHRVQGQPIPSICFLPCWAFSVTPGVPKLNLHPTTHTPPQKKKSLIQKPLFSQGLLCRASSGSERLWALEIHVTGQNASSVIYWF